ncbi:Kinesin motor domain-containing protein [Fusarium sp. LHS14.1]|nr:Kinesin motor domain-containing protein [Fusarium sp. LHS14.1]
MASSPPTSPGGIQRPLSAAISRAAPRSTSRLSMTSKTGGGSRASDEDSRTAVKVAVRVRPPLKSTDPGYDLIPQRFQRSMVQTTSDTSLAIDSPQGRKLFVFDRVFSSDVMQDGIWDYLSDCVGAFTQGYNVSLLAYGQSGAGKSYTMGTSGPGEQHDPELMGVIPRAATALFEKLDAPTGSAKSNRSSMSHLRSPRGYAQQDPLGDRNWSLKATYVEIYNEQLRDLLVPESTPLNERGNVAIREDTKGNIILTGLRQIEVKSVDDLMNALNFGSSIRQTDATAINAKSSRSHAVFSLNLVQRKSKYGSGSGTDKRHSVPLEAMTGQDVTVTVDSKLHFVDLAGSERLKNTGAQGERAKEGISINAGLAALGKVISQLSSRNPGAHVSYRDSRLTRLLQDSLGGNAITYMIACVTPAEFHLSETLNTVQYAQRARAIQSKPRIQQVEEGDKQAVIDRLKAEVAFLREQIRSAERSGSSPRRNAPGPSERSDRQNEREVELQNQLLDTQENYTALSQRHARLIAELARARENESEENHDDALGDSATDRLNRSNSFAQAVEQVVLEYEKTIQSLEQSLSSTRSTLSNTETNLLEKETKCAYVETINNQLQSRLQKLMDREASTENYLHDLEAKLDGHTSGEEKNATIIMELRKEIARVRENEASCEDYISTLEERLAEADQDSELMQREIDRLEQVVERQRSLGKLDSLLYELDQIQDGKEAEGEKAPESAPAEPTNGTASRRGMADHSRSMSHVSRHSQMEEPIPEGDEEQDTAQHKIGTVKEEAEDDKQHLDRPEEEVPPQSPAQSKFVADKLESVTQELIDLRVEHESTLHDYDSLHHKYEDAIRKLAELQDSIDEARHPQRIRDSVISVATPIHTRPESFLSDAKTNDLKDGPRSSFSRSLSSELSSAMDSPATAASSNADTLSEDGTATAKPEAVSTEDLQHAQSVELAAELDRLKAMAHEREAAEKELAERYAQLESKHSETLDIVEELKTDLTRARAYEATSPRSSTPIIRRKSSQNLLVADRAHRSFASLRNIAAESFDHNPELMQSFELNINAAMHELHTRSERIQELEADVASAKKEMETKMTIISGLTRERSSLKSSPIEMSMVANLRDQLEQSERQLNDTRNAHLAREQTLTTELESLRQALASRPDPKDVEESEQKHEERIAELQSELETWENKHKEALDTMAKTEAAMRGTIQELESQVASTSAQLTDSQSHQTGEKDDSVREAEQRQQNLISFLRSEIDEYKAIINSNAAKVAELEQSHSAARSQLDELNKAHASVQEDNTHQLELVAKLEEQIAAHDEATKSHQTSLEELKANHVKELADIKTREQKGYEEQVEVLLSEHADSVQRLENELGEARDDLMKIASQVAFALGLDVSVEKLTERINDLAVSQQALAEEKKKRGEMESHVTELTTINDKIVQDLEAARASLAEMLGAADKPAPLAEQLTAAKNKMADLDTRSKKNSRLVEELEEQLQNNFDEVQMTNNRLSTLQTERNVALDEANAATARLQAELEVAREDYATLQQQAKFDELNAGVQRSNSNSTIRKSASHVSLPSPPPAIPLPPLPSGAGSPVNGVPSSPTNARPASKDNINISQITEDQEARIRTIEKHLDAERQLTQTLEDALTDLEKQTKQVKSDCDAWKKRAQELESEVKELKDRPPPEPVQDNRWSVQAVEEERKKRQAAEAARRQLEERMNAISKSKKKKGSLNCF